MLTIHTGFCETCRKLWSKGNPCIQREEIQSAFDEARKNTNVPTLIEFIIDPEDLVYPMIRPGGTLEDMLMDC